MNGLGRNGSSSASHNGDGAPPPSKRWTYFDKARHRATNHATHKWTLQDFKECFPLWSEDQPRGVEGTYSTMSSYTEKFIQENCARILQDHDARASIDRLDAVVSAAQTLHKQNPLASPPPDAWRESLSPRQAIRARTIPVLRAERDRMRLELAALEAENKQTMVEVEANQRQASEAQEEIQEVLDISDRVREVFEARDMDGWRRWVEERAE